MPSIMPLITSPIIRTRVAPADWRQLCVQKLIDATKPMPICGEG